MTVNADFRHLLTPGAWGPAWAIDCSRQHRDAWLSIVVPLCFRCPNQMLVGKRRILMRKSFCKNFESFLMDNYALSWTTEIFFFQNILNNKIVVQVIKFTANSTWKRQAVFLIMQFEKHMSKHKWISLLKILPARLARHSTVGWKAVNRELRLLPSC